MYDIALPHEISAFRCCEPEKNAALTDGNKVIFHWWVRINVWETKIIEMAKITYQKLFKINNLNCI